MKNTNLLFVLTITSFFLVISSCTQSTFDDIEGNTEPIPELVTYQDIQPIINSSCLACHSNPPQNGAPMSLATYDMVKEAVLNRELSDRINRNPGDDGLMPLGGPRLPQQTINLLFKWEEDGLLEN